MYPESRAPDGTRGAIRIAIRAAAELSECCGLRVEIASSKMSRPRHLGSSPSLNRSLSRLSSSSSFQVRQSNSRIYTFLVAGGLILLSTVGLLQVHLLRAPQGSKLSPLENGKPDEGVGAEQGWWKENAGEGSVSARDLDQATGKSKGAAKGNKLGRKMGAVQRNGDGDAGETADDDMDTGDELGDDDDEDVEQDLFDIDVDDRMLDEETEDLEAVDLRILAEMSNEEDTPAADAKETAQAVAATEKHGVAPVKEKSWRQDDRTGKGNAIPDWVLDGKLGDTLHNGVESDLVKELEKKKESSFFWDHALGIRKRSALENVEPRIAAKEAAKDRNVDIQRLAAGDEDAASVAFVQLRGFKEVVQNWRERFNSDDELVDENVEERLEGVHEIEDALLLNGDAASGDKAAPSKKFGGYLKKARGSFDAMNPANNPMLQDPDTEAGTWMTKTDKEMLRAIQGDRSKALLRGSNILIECAKGSAAAGVIQSDQEGSANAKANRSVSEERNLVFVETFLGQESCTLRVFMVWSTPAWGFTARYQRVLESLFRFHRHACVVVLSETLQIDVFNSFVKDGYKVVVVRPNLQELLAETPSHIFTAVLPKWKENPLFHLHYSELLRLAALYKFGGVYLDMDMLVLRPLDNLHNTVGSELSASGDLRLNGALLAFDKSSLFLKKCMEEFTRTYDETSAQFNGADLLTRVANSTVDDKGSTWTQFPDLLKIEGPFTFFPLDSSGISKFFAAPEDDIQKQEQGQLLTRISEEAFTVHLWNSLTSNLVPETKSLVGIILSRSCLLCKNVL